MDMSEALLVLLRDSRAEKSSLASYKRTVRALNWLGAGEIAQATVLQYLEYHGSDDKPYPWLARKLTP